MELLGRGLDLLIVIIGFGALIFVHELGHFLAAKWAGVRVLAFAIGFGKALVTYRPGMGLSSASTEGEYLKRVAAKTDAGISPTEYRFNWIPFGGYVKMLGQVDGDPAQTSDAPDSYQKCKVWKRMIIISAGVIMNLITAGLLFMIVFKVGLKTEPATVGMVLPGSPASRALATGGPGDAAGQAGLRAGDVIVSIQGDAPRSFNDVVMAVAMTPRGNPVNLTVDRPGTGRIDFAIQPESSSVTRLMEIGVAPPLSGELPAPTRASEREQLTQVLARVGAKGVEPGMRLARAGVLGENDVKIRGAQALDDAAAASGGRAFDAEFVDAGGQRVTTTLVPRAQLQDAFTPMPTGNTATPISHLLGLTPVMAVAPATDPTMDRQGLKDHDVFARIGAVEFPSIADGIAEIRRHKGQRVEVTVLRLAPDGSRSLVRLDPPPMVLDKDGGQIGFSRQESSDLGTWVARPPLLLADARTPLDKAQAGPAASVITAPGTRIVAVNGRTVGNFTELREALKDAGAARVLLTLELPSAAGTPERVERSWTLSDADAAALRSLSWTSPLPVGLFEPEQILLKGTGPIDAVRLGMSETRRVIVMTYLTFARLFDGTVKVEHLKGPIGIAHIGTRIIDRGIIWLLFFLALLSVNLAVINFLPLPIVDGGQFLFLCYEGLRGRPAPVAVQNITAIAGMVLIGAMFLIVTFHDVLRLFG